MAESGHEEFDEEEVPNGVDDLDNDKLKNGQVNLTQADRIKLI